jgi:hypothetical protein
MDSTETARQALAAPTGIVRVTTNDLGIVAVTTGTTDSPRLVCLGHFPDPVLGEFERDELEPDEKCHECGATLGQPLVDLDDPGAVLSLVMESLIRADTVEVNLYDDGVEIAGPDDIRLGVLHGTFTPPQVAGYLRIDEQDIRDRRDADNN